MIEQLTEDEIEQLANDIVTNVVYWPPDENALKCSFEAILALGVGEMPEAELENIGWVCEEWSNAGELAVNGYPMFLSCRLIHKDSVLPVLQRVRAKAELLGLYPISDEERET